MKIQELVIADVSSWLHENANYIVSFEFVEGKATIVVNDLHKSAYNEIRDIALENDFKIDIVHDSIILY